MSSFFDFSKKKTSPDLFDEKSKTGLGFEFGQPQRKYQRRPTLQSMANPAVDVSDFPLMVQACLGSLRTYVANRASFSNIFQLIFY